MTVLPSKASTRQAYWDVARAFLMFLGIPFHSALIYVTPGFGIYAVENSVALEYLEVSIHSF